ncbi:MAG: hypothetical protein M3O50_05490, partial [Myxococcota bacterium]|nr:hypothetical protein [Myxococcota bacterium]
TPGAGRVVDAKERLKIGALLAVHGRIFVRIAGGGERGFLGEPTSRHGDNRGYSPPASFAIG